MSLITAVGAFENEVKVKLEKIQWVVMSSFDASILEGCVDVEFWEDWSKEYLAARVVGSVWGEDFARRTIRYPRDWIEAAKERWLPYWLRSRWPVRYKVHHIEAKAYYPGIKPSLRNYEHEWRIAAYVRDQDEGKEE